MTERPGRRGNVERVSPPVEMDGNPNSLTRIWRVLQFFVWDKGMAKIRILHTADCHLAAAFASLGPNAERRRRDVLDAFRGLVDFALGGKGNAAKDADGVVVGSEIVRRVERGTTREARVASVRALVRELRQAI